MLKIVKGRREGFCYSIYIRHVRIYLPFLLVILGLSACRTEEDGCPAIWSLNKSELPVYATADSGQIVLTAWHPVSSNVIELNQVGLNGDFELDLSLDSLQWDSLVSPQFRFEVFNAEDPNADVCGVAINPLVAYCYVGSGPENRDMRLISAFSGILSIRRTNGSIICTSTLGDVSFQYSDTLNNNEMGVRLILGSTQSSTGKTEAWLGSFNITSANANTRVKRDDFDCESW
jgi:hypothetical protein